MNDEYRNSVEESRSPMNAGTTSAPIHRIEATVNAVMVQIDDKGKRLVSIVCRDPEMLQSLHEEARRILSSDRG